MEIKCTTLYSLELFKKFNRFHMVKNKARVALLAILEIAVLLILVVFCLTNAEPAYIAIYGFIAVMIPVMYIIAPQIAAKKSKNLLGIETEFTFTDDVIVASSKGENIVSSGEMKYELFYKVYETSDAFYLYQTKMQAFPILKQNVEENRIDDLRNLLINKMGKRYKGK